MSKGHDRERQVRRILEEEGWWVGRCAGSLGDADLVALRATSSNGDPRAMLVEVKANRGSAYMHFGPEARRRLSHAAEYAGAEAWLFHAAPDAPLRRIPESRWP